MSTLVHPSSLPAFSAFLASLPPDVRLWPRIDGDQVIFLAREGHSLSPASVGPNQAFAKSSTADGWHAQFSAFRQAMTEWIQGRSALEVDDAFGGRRAGETEEERVSRVTGRERAGPIGREEVWRR